MQSSASQSQTAVRHCYLHWAGQVPYDVSWAWQRSLVALKKHDPSQPDWLLLLEHPPVYTLGQGASLEFVKGDSTARSIPLHRTERGGEVTYHAPGQLVGYPILDLRHYRQDLHWYLRQLEEVIIQAIAPFGFVGERVAGLTGVWVEGRKVAAIGIKVSRWITMHGFAVNVCPDLRGFQDIVPCGIADRPVGALAEWQPDLTVEMVREAIAQAMTDVFQTTLCPTSTPVLQRTLELASAIDGSLLSRPIMPP
ncbi:lipoyl(octanoyl) transferase LipB [Vacuolonema iberomarrocanum]|uniref:lipoyl(octanoyl) transferase LipB n=1 Tax=Vacuolonema iberomarrocanum TaxID=3454632 RepID=UPI001A06E667|nr:lipoyl(octanoyl) transferase LipB [filamentous cyanobacterium LEGE 07170]